MHEMREKVQEEETKIQKALDMEEQILRQEAFSSSARESWEVIRNELKEDIGFFFLEATEEEKRSLIELLIERVILTHGEKKHVIIRFKIPLTLHLEEKYMENMELFADDEYGKETSIGMYTFPKIFPLGEFHMPIVSHEVQFEESEYEENEGKKQEEKEEKNKNNK